MRDEDTLRAIVADDGDCGLAGIECSDCPLRGRCDHSSEDWRLKLAEQMRRELREKRGSTLGYEVKYAQV